MKNLILLFFLFTAGSSQAQSPATINNLSLEIKKVTLNSPYGTGEKAKISTASLNLDLSTTNDVAFVKVRLGTGAGTGDIVSKSLPLTSGENGMVINGNTVTINLGQVKHKGTVYAEATLQYTDNTTSSTVTTTGN
ncbi:MAG: hypothetical protein POELPBGB_03612 [Bacteroidia bacterium]|nr:hypothetical protein [Bacteroidia bacterium]